MQIEICIVIILDAIIGIMDGSGMHDCREWAPWVQYFLCELLEAQWHMELPEHLICKVIMPHLAIQIHV